MVYESTKAGFSYSDFSDWWGDQDSDKYPNLKNSKIPLRNLYEVIGEMDSLSKKYGEVVANELAEDVSSESLASNEYISIE